MKANRFFAISLFLSLLLLVNSVSATSTYWIDDFTTDNFKTTGDPSDAYWLIVIDNSNLTKTISDGILTLTHSRASASGEQNWCAKRLANAETDISSKIKWKLPTSPHQNFSAIVGVMKNSTHWVWMLEMTSTTIRLGVYATNGSFVWYPIISNPTIDQWYSYTITAKVNAVSITNGTSTLQYQSLFSYSDCSEYILKTRLASGTESASGTVAIDYIYWGSATQLVMPWIPVVVLFAMLGVALGMLNKITKER
jgi:hypothetical protein